jgi:hypothetical protein
MKVLRPYKGDFREVFDGEAARIILLDFERVLARETEEPLPCALSLLTGHRRSAAFARGIVPASPPQETTPTKRAKESMIYRAIKYRGESGSAGAETD